jgi:hypothetical protein
MSKEGFDAILRSYGELSKGVQTVPAKDGILEESWASSISLLGVMGGI